MIIFKKVYDILTLLHFSHDVLPIVMGARPEDYERSAPHKSFLHVDNFASPAALAEYLHVLDKDDTLYNEYFQWKGTGEMIDTKFFCRMCSLLHDKKVFFSFYNINFDKEMSIFLVVRNPGCKCFSLKGWMINDHGLFYKTS